MYHRDMRSGEVEPHLLSQILNSQTGTLFQSHPEPF